MGKCIRCGKKGLFLKVNKDGYCNDCAVLLAEEAVEKDKKLRREAAYAKIRFENWQAQLAQKRKEEEEEIERKRKEQEQIEFHARWEAEWAAKQEKERLEKEAVDEFLNTIPDTSTTIVPEVLHDTFLMEKELKITNITPKFNKNRIYPLVVLDTETTGIRVTGTEILEISAIKYEQEGLPVAKFSTLIKPKKPIPDDATKVNHITDQMVKDAPMMKEIALPFTEFIYGCNLLAQNAMFDIKHLLHHGVRINSDKIKIFDTLEIAKKQLKGPKRKWDKDLEEYVMDDWDADVPNYKLESLCDYFEIPVVNAHRAIYDCYATYQVFDSFVKRIVL